MFRIIGEKINGTRKRVAAAIAERDAAFVASLAQRQVAAGAHWVDLNAGTHPDREVADLVWLVETVQGAVDSPALPRQPERARARGRPCRHQADAAHQLHHGRARAPRRHPAAGAGERRGRHRARDGGARHARHGGGPDDGPAPAGRRHPGSGIADDRVYLDPLVMTIATNTEAAVIALETIRQVRAEFPDAHISCGLSNVSFGLPVRGLINRTFLSLAVSAGLDTAILDPLDRDLAAALLATELLLGRDKHCLGYTRAYRAGLLEAGPAPTAPA